MKYILILTVLLASTTIAAATFDETMAAAKQGEAYAQFNLGVMYDKGEGVKTKAQLYFPTKFHSH